MISKFQERLWVLTIRYLIKQVSHHFHTYHYFNHFPLFDYMDETKSEMSQAFRTKQGGARHRPTSARDKQTTVHAARHLRGGGGLWAASAGESAEA